MSRLETQCGFHTGDIDEPHAHYTIFEGNCFFSKYVHSSRLRSSGICIDKVVDGAHVGVIKFFALKRDLRVIAAFVQMSLAHTKSTSGRDLTQKKRRGALRVLRIIVAERAKPKSLSRRSKTHWIGQDGVFIPQRRERV